VPGFANKFASVAPIFPEPIIPIFIFSVSEPNYVFVRYKLPSSEVREISPNENTTKNYYMSRKGVRPVYLFLLSRFAVAVGLGSD